MTMSTYLRGVGWIIFWFAVGILGVLVVPVKHNTNAIPMMVFSVIVLAVGSALWGTGVIGQRLAVSGATLVFVLTILSFFLPLTAKRVPEKVKSFDTWLASPPAPETTYTTAARPPAQAAAAQHVEALVPEHECHTPCSHPIDFKFELDTQGDPIDLKFPGVRELVHYSGKGTIVVPSYRDTGNVEIISPNPSKRAWVRIWRVKTVATR